MSDTRILFPLIAFALTFSPVTSFAEESAATNGATEVTTTESSSSVTPPAKPPKPADGWSFGESRPQTPPRAGEGKMMQPGATGTKPILRPNIISPRDSASGLPTGKMLQGSGTPQILPGRAKEMMEKRDLMMGSGTPGRIGTGTPGRIGTGTPMMGGRMEDRMKDARERLGKDRGEQAKEFVRITMSRLRAAIDRIVKIMERVESRIAKLESEGRDVGDARESINRAKTEIENAKNALTKAEEVFTSYVPPTANNTATGTQERMQPGMGQPSPVRDALKDAGEAVKSAHKELTNAIKHLGVGSTKPSDTGTTSASSN